jgi:hypothetical protein
VDLAKVTLTYFHWDILEIIYYVSCFLLCINKV